MSFSVTLGGTKSVPPGEYVAEFVSVEEADGDFGPSWLWKFSIVGGMESGKTVKRYTSQRVGPTTAAHAIICGLAGLSIGSEQEIQVGDYVGKNFRILVEQTASGGSRVAKVSPLDANVPF